MGLSGPISYSNWIAFEQGAELRTVVEYPLYTDARIIGEIYDGYGPYKFLNTVPTRNGLGILQPSIVLRAGYYLDVHIPSRMEETDTSNYHGGYFPDEVAALASLCLGVRVKAADESRRFDSGDPLGRPQAFRFRDEPIMSLGDKRLKLPNAIGPHSLEKLSPIKKFPKLSRSGAIAVIRAARLYQDALWIGESEPALSWLMFVSALEVGANVWQMSEDTLVCKLKASKPKLYKTLNDTGIVGLTEDVANEIVHTLGATNKFIKFVIEHLPEPPDNRPQEWAQINWSPKFLKKALDKIYEYRSNALHSGIPFPAPMCDAGMLLDKCMAEKPTGLASYQLGGTWVAKDTPMLLHMFEYIARGVLINWINRLEHT